MPSAWARTRPVQTAHFCRVWRALIGARETLQKWAMASSVTKSSSCSYGTLPRIPGNLPEVELLCDGCKVLNATPLACVCTLHVALAMPAACPSHATRVLVPFKGKLKG